MVAYCTGSNPIEIGDLGLSHFSKKSRTLWSMITDDSALTQRSKVAKTYTHTKLLFKSLGDHSFTFWNLFALNSCTSTVTRVMRR